MKRSARKQDEGNRTEHGTDRDTDTDRDTHARAKWNGAWKRV